MEDAYWAYGLWCMESEFNVLLVDSDDYMPKDAVAI
jgi:hypothetical protein